MKELLSNIAVPSTATVLALFCSNFPWYFISHKVLFQLEKRGGQKEEAEMLEVEKGEWNEVTFPVYIMFIQLTPGPAIVGAQAYSKSYLRGASQVLMEELSPSHVKYQLLCSTSPPDTHIFPTHTFKPLKSISLAQLQYVPTGRPPTVKVPLPNVPKTTPPRYHHYQTPLLEPRYLDSSWHNYSVRIILKLSIAKAALLCPAKEFAHFALLFATQIPKQSSQALVGLLVMLVETGK